MNRNTLTNHALTDVCELLEDYELTSQEVAELASNIAAEMEGRAEQAWERQQASLMESGGPDDSHYRRTMHDAGRGHLVKG